MYERLDTEAQRVLSNAQAIAKEFGYSSVDAEHLMLALLMLEPICEVLEKLQLEPANIKEKLFAVVKTENRELQANERKIVSLSPRLRRILELAWLEVAAISQKAITPTHLLLGLLREEKSKSVTVLNDTRKGSSQDSLLKQLYAILGNSSDQAGNSDLAQAYYGQLYTIDQSDTRIPRAYSDLLKNKGKKETATLSRFDQYSIIEESEVIEEPSVNFDAVAGISDPRSEYYRIRRIFELAFLYPEQYRELANEYGVASTGTLLLFGPTGVGKTFICRAMAGEFSKRTGRKLTFINARLSSVLDKWVGNTEKNITKLIQIAIEKSPSLLLLDEIESLGTDRAGAGKDYRIDWVNHLLLELDRLRNSRKPVLVVACTNSIAQVDLALRRRLGNPIIIPMPDQSVRAQAFRLYIEKVSPSVRDNIDYDTLAKATPSFTPSDIQEVAQETTNRVWLEMVEELTKGESSRKRQLGTRDFLATLNNKTPSVPISKWVKESLEHLRKTGDEALAQRLVESFKGYYATSDFSLMPMMSPQKWFAEKA